MAAYLFDEPALLEAPSCEQDLSSMVDLDNLTKEEILLIARRRGGFAVWECRTTLRKYHSAVDADDITNKGLLPDEIVKKDFNLLTFGGAGVMWQCLIGNGVTTADQTLTYFNNARAAIGVGDATTTPAATQTDLQASTNKLRVAMASTYPTHTDATTSGAATITFQSTFTTGQANYAWNEVGIFNSTSAGTGRMLLRLAPAGGYGTKASGSWSLSVAVSLA